MDETQFEEKRERRSGKDRRARPTSPFTIQSLRGSRQHYRRKEDTRKLFFVDLYSPLSVAVLVFTLCLSIVDAFLTLVLVGHNAEELNPVMDFFLKLGPVQFIMVKLFLTAFGLTTLLILKNYYLWHGRVKAAALLFIFPFLYLVLVGYEILITMKG
jgi:hypothetical protein